MANSRSFPSGTRFYSSTINENHAAPGFQFIYDRTITWNNPNGGSYTGGWRAVTPSDLAANISVSGLSISVGAVAVTGNPQVTINSGTFGFNINSITNSQVQIPQNSKSYNVAVESGSAYLNGVQINAPMSIGGGGYDGRFLLAAAINIGCTGGRAIISWEI